MAVRIGASPPFGHRELRGPAAGPLVLRNRNRRPPYTAGMQALVAVASLVIPLFAAGQDEDPGLTYHGPPGPLAEDAVTEASPGFLGPRRDGHSSETKLRHDFGPEGPALVWERERGESYAPPAVARGVLVFPHAEGDTLHVDGIHPETGRLLWRRSRPFDYEPRYIRNKGPRATPTIDGEAVYVLGVDHTLSAFQLQDGKPLWQRDLRKEFGAKDDFFGAVASPLALDDALVLNIGAEGGPSVVALAKKDGELLWGVESSWGASCASPVLAEIGGKPRLLVVAGGESRPPTGGLLVLDPATGKEQFRYDFRSRTYESVLGSSPVVGGDTVLLTAGYNTGTAAVKLGEGGVWSEAWKLRDLGCEFQNPVYANGLFQLVDGLSSRVGALVALDPESGETVARTSLTWTETIHLQGSEPLERTSSIGQASLLAVDGALLVLGDSGHLLWVRSGPDGATVEARAKLFFARETWSPPVVHRGLLYVCQNNVDRETGKGPRLLCYDLRAGAASDSK